MLDLPERRAADLNGFSLTLHQVFLSQSAWKALDELMFPPLFLPSGLSAVSIDPVLLGRSVMDFARRRPPSSSHSFLFL